MDSRRDFIKKAAMLTGGAGLFSVLPNSIQKALAINPAPGTTYLDAEHVVILMQENRSFDHSYGSLRGVRGFNDPRAIRLPNKNLVWLQTNAFGETHVPFRMNMKESRATWMGSLPHTWPNQVDARNNGKYDKWLIAKQAGHKDYKRMPLTQGFYNREDIPFYYALADAFTVCDQNFCSSLTGTTPNRLYLWTGTLREKPDENSYANVRNENVTDDREANWKTFPERLEDANVSWRIYQNELSIDTGFQGEEDSWLSNFTDNPIEWFSQYQIRFHTGYQTYLKKRIKELPAEIAAAENNLKTASGEDAVKLGKTVADKKASLKLAQEEIVRWSPENFEKLSQKQKNIHQKAFTTNSGDPDYRKITTVSYNDGDIIHEAKAPQGDILHQFRADVKANKLPTVSWLVAPENFSDHPTAPWYGAWYVSETMDILTKNPEIWKKTIFILCYDENDGYFDHIPPFVVPDPYKENSGKTSEGIDTKIEFVTLEQDMKKKPKKDSRESPIGLGYRVPLVVASPWNRGGSVCSEVFDHTSILQFLEKFVSHKSGKEIKETNISEWRRTICGDLTSTFKPYDGKDIPLPRFVDRVEFMESIHNAQFRKLPNDYKVLTAEEVARINQDPLTAPIMPKQEKGTRPASAIPYELYADGKLNTAKNAFEIKLKAGNGIFGKGSVGAPFMIYAYGVKGEQVQVRNYAVKAGDQLSDQWKLDDFDNSEYHLVVYGPNGFMREYTGKADNQSISIDYQLDKNRKATGNILVKVFNGSKSKTKVTITDNLYKASGLSKVTEAASSKPSETSILLDLQKNFNWYDFTVSFEGPVEQTIRFAGHVETGNESQSDPYMGQVI
ncbi:phosphocholine-specific phospholipase C [Dyadobacter sp. CY312]|uniref:phosphocholine-specific phospholipase C n=1 Tax=Dyadobacter sp. CY312 TaxID=2907303 RepID=UPI001F32E0FD|nr:phospholipase C, phosphocholine-specific [Dyadobacter sp. CY312]MCE7039463.1 phospholipase C, phosphocholine-specific [Dyadobacter sp. CY312]